MTVATLLRTENIFLVLMFLFLVAHLSIFLPRPQSDPLTVTDYKVWVHPKTS